MASVFTFITPSCGGGLSDLAGPESVIDGETTGGELSGASDDLYPSDADICFNFSEPIDPSTACCTIVGGTAGDVATSISLSGDNKVICCVPDDALLPGQSYTFATCPTVTNVEGRVFEPSSHTVNITCSQSDSFNVDTILNSSDHPQCWSCLPDPYNGISCGNIWSIGASLYFDAPQSQMITESDGMQIFAKKLPCDSITATLRFESWSLNVGDFFGEQYSDSFSFFVASESIDVSSDFYRYGIKHLTYNSSYPSCMTFGAFTPGPELALATTGTGADNPCNISSGLICLRISVSNGAFSSYYSTDCENYTRLHSGAQDAYGDLLSNTITGDSCLWGIQPMTINQSGTAEFTVESFTVSSE